MAGILHYAYNCMVRPGGHITHEVPKHGISAKEVQLLRMLHGNDAVFKIERVGEFRDYNETTEYQLLAMRYGDALISRAFSVDLSMLGIEKNDRGKHEYIEDFKIIEADAKGVDLREVAQEAGPVRRVVSNTEGFCINEAARVAQAVPSLG